jgi:hypothetical protein
MTRRTLIAILAVATLLTASLHAQKFSNVWKTTDKGPFDFTGKKVAAVVITNELAIQMSGEEQLVRELTARGMQGVAAYRIIPKEELRDATKAKEWFAKNKIAGAVVLNVIAAEKEKVYSPTVWGTAYYNTFWNYYATSWTAVHSYSTREDRIVTIETLVYDIEKDKLIWAGVTQKVNPKGAQKTVTEIVKEAAEEMKKSGLVKGK